MVFWSFGLLVVWSFGLLIFWNFGLLAFGLLVLWIFVLWVFWSLFFWSLVFWSFGRLVFWPFVFYGLLAFDLLVFWSYGLLSLCRFVRLRHAGEHFPSVLAFEGAAEAITQRLYEDARQELGSRLDDSHVFFFISVPNQERDSHTQSPEQNGWRRKPLRYTVHKGEVSDLVGAGLQQLALQYPHAAARTAFV